MLRRSVTRQISSARFLSTTLKPTATILLRTIPHHQSQTAALYQPTLRRPYTEHSSHSTIGDAVPEEIEHLSLYTYHSEADKFLDNLLDALEDISENHPIELPDVELNHGVMTIQVPALGTYVINKQPPNKQIWLSSPVSGPDRFDFVKNEWVSLRNNLKLIDILNDEIKQVLPGEELHL